jgi:hypothetical protein
VASLLLVVVLLLSISAPASAARSAPGESPKVSHLRDGSTVTAFPNGRVVVRALGGRVTSDSDFGSYRRYLQWVTLAARTARDHLDQRSLGLSPRSAARLRRAAAMLVYLSGSRQVVLSPALSTQRELNATAIEPPPPPLSAG